jgi:hypothetical protein
MDMTTDTAGSKAPQAPFHAPTAFGRVFLQIALASGAVFCGSIQASPSAGPWGPIFKGIDYAVGTNDPAIPGNFPRLQVVRCVRIDLTDPDVHLFTTPPASNYSPESRETLTLSVPDFLQRNLLQVASDANYYDAFPGGSDPTSEGISCEVSGLQICTGQVVSAQSAADQNANVRTCSLLFSTNNHPSFVFVNSPPGTNLSGIYNAITGYYPLVSDGVNIGAASINSYPDSFIHQVQPRTAFGVSQNARYLYLLTIDGRQQGYSDGALDTETAYWLLQFGAWDGINMDGGGSTSLYMAGTAGNPVALNHSSYLPATGHERYVGSHFGVYAKPLPGAINGVTAFPDDTAASITWSTTNASDSLVQYGLTPAFGFASPFYTAMVTNHAVLLTNLAPGTLYYYRVFSSDVTTQYSAGPFVFTTTNYASTNLLFDFTNSWSYQTANLDGVNWTAPGYDDSGWPGSGPGLLWVDTRGFANPNIPLPMLTPMPANGSSPYTTYYFRTHFSFTNSLTGVTLPVTDYLDDGAVFYLNGHEINRVRMPATPILNSTLASSGTACGGDATCPDNWILSGDLATNLAVGDNVLAVEAHNFNPGSPDVTFGMALSYTSPFAAPPELSIQQSNSVATVSWTRGGFTLQQAASPAGLWSAVPGPIVISPYSTTNTSQAVYYRLIK